MIEKIGERTMSERDTEFRIVATHHLALYTANFDRLRAFYTETLGLPVLGGFPEQRILFLDAGTTAIELVEVAGEEAARRPAEDGGWAHLALEVEEIDVAYAVLSARGVTFHIPPEDFPPDAPAVRIAFCTDPDGNVLELLQPLGSRYPAIME